MVKDPAIQKLQAVLNAKLRPSPGLNADGIMGPKTRAALLQYNHLKDKTGTPAHLITASAAKELPALPHVPAADKWMNIAIGENDKGVIEIPGAESNPTIDAYLATTTLPKKYQNDDTAWCAAFVNWVIEQAGYVGKKSAAAKDWVNWGVACKPQYGAVIVIHKKGAKADAATGSGSGNHVGFLFDRTTTHCKILGGNQSGGTRVSIVSFSLVAYEVLAYRWPEKA